MNYLFLRVYKVITFISYFYLLLPISCTLQGYCTNTFICSYWPSQDEKIDVRQVQSSVFVSVYFKRDRKSKFHDVVQIVCSLR